MNKNRGILLTLLIIYFGLSYTFVLKDFSKQASGYNIFTFSQSILGLISLVGIWQWKKWAVYLQIALYAVSYILSLFFFQIPQYGKNGSAIFFMLVFTAILAILGYIALKRKWKYFS